MTQLFLINEGKEYSYEQLIGDLNEKETYSNYLYSEANDPYKIFLRIIHSLLHDYPLEVIDGDFSEEELQALAINEIDLAKEQTIKEKRRVATMEELFLSINEVQNWQLTLYTSGTTGQPKKVSHSLANLTRNVKVGTAFSENVWAFAYNPTHMAGLQVFFQAFFNENTIVYFFNKPLSMLAKLFTSHEISNISATPTFYRNVLPYLSDSSYRSVRYVTLGGEKYDVSLEDALKTVFPQAKLRNIYAATETGSLFTAKGEVFRIKEALTDLVKISAENELLIHESLLGESATFTLQDGWYHTGDIVEKLDDETFKFVSRQTDIINVGGYNVNPLEVEAVLKEIPGVKDAIVKSRSNRVTGEMIVADVVKDEAVDAKELKSIIRQYTTEHLQEWKVPRIVTFVDEIKVSRTGKRVRQ